MKLMGVKPVKPLWISWSIHTLDKRLRLMICCFHNSNYLLEAITDTGWHICVETAVQSRSCDPLLVREGGGELHVGVTITWIQPLWWFLSWASLHSRNWFPKSRILFAKFCSWHCTCAMNALEVFKRGWCWVAVSKLFKTTSNDFSTKKCSSYFKDRTFT